MVLAVLSFTLSYVIPVLGFLFVFGLVVLVHELGHFLTAKFSDVEVEAFSLGMGPNILAYPYGETEYRIGWLPLGGYVSLAGEEPSEAGDNPRAFYNKSVWTRALVLVAGAAGNLILGYVIYVLFGLFVGEMVMPAKIGYVSPDKPAHNKLQIGDEIVSLNGYRVDTFQDVSIRNELLGDQLRRFVIRRDGTKKTVTIDPVRQVSGPLGQPSYIVGIQPYQPPVIGSLEPGGRAASLGFQEGDRIRKVAGERVQSWVQFLHLLNDHRGEQVTVVYERSGEQHTQQLSVPADEEAWGEWIGGFGWSPPRTVRNYGPLESLAYGVRRTVRTVTLMFEGLVGLLTQTISPKSLAGPIGIADMTGTVSTAGILPLLSFTAFFSINLGVINLLPIPVLDGGHILLSIPEMFTGQPLPESVMRAFNYVGLSIILALFLFVTMIDLCRYEWFTRLFGSVCRF